MKVIICGAGQVGWQIARHLSGENNDVTVIDSDPDLVRRAADTLDVTGIAGFASYPDVLERAGARDADMVIAATHSDEVNMVTCQVAHSIFAVPRKIARLRAQSYLTAIYSDLYRRDHLPIDVVISPEREVADAALQRLAAPATFDTESFLDDEVRLIGIVLDADCPILNTPLRQLSELFSTLFAMVVGVRREQTLFAPVARGSALCRRSDLCADPDPRFRPDAGDFRQADAAAGAYHHRRRRACRAGRRARAGTAAGPDAGEDHRARPRRGGTRRRRAGAYDRAAWRRARHGVAGRGGGGAGRCHPDGDRRRQDQPAGGGPRQDRRLCLCHCADQRSKPDRADGARCTWTRISTRAAPPCRRSCGISGRGGCGRSIRSATPRPR
jgi:Trk K+ transport system NAD-binding subunit